MFRVDRTAAEWNMLLKCFAAGAEFACRILICNWNVMTAATDNLQKRRRKWETKSSKYLVQSKIADTRQQLAEAAGRVEKILTDLKFQYGYIS